MKVTGGNPFIELARTYRQEQQQAAQQRDAPSTRVEAMDLRSALLKPVTEPATIEKTGDDHSRRSAVRGSLIDIRV